MSPYGVHFLVAMEYEGHDLEWVFLTHQAQQSDTLATQVTT